MKLSPYGVIVLSESVHLAVCLSARRSVNFFFQNLLIVQFWLDFVQTLHILRYNVQIDTGIDNINDSGINTGIEHAVDLDSV